MVAGELETPVRWRDRVALRFHLLLCRHCRRFAKQIGAIRHGSREMYTHLAADSGGEGSEESDHLTARIVARLSRGGDDTCR